MKKPIPRLYVAGEISSIYGHLYLEARNITECFVAGKMPGRTPRRKGRGNNVLGERRRVPVLATKCHSNQEDQNLALVGHGFKLVVIGGQQEGAP
jgi:hypothetical protein